MDNYNNNSNKKLEAYLLAVICVSLKKKKKNEKKLNQKLLTSVAVADKAHFILDQHQWWAFIVIYAK